MDFEMKKANMLANHIHEFIIFVDRLYNTKSSVCSNFDKMYQIKLLIEEYQLRSLADELLRINMYTWDHGYTHLLISRFRKGLSVIDEYVENNSGDLFILSARIHTLKNLSTTFTQTSGIVRERSKMSNDHNN